MKQKKKKERKIKQKLEKDKIMKVKKTAKKQEIWNKEEEIAKSKMEAKSWYLKITSKSGFCKKASDRILTKKL